jgi:hypothetical protein
MCPARLAMMSTRTAATAAALTATLERAASAPEHCQFEVPQARGVGEYVDFDNLPALDCDAHDRQRLSIGKPRNDSRRSVHALVLWGLRITEPQSGAH